jgi:hypothetical protein
VWEGHLGGAKEPATMVTREQNSIFDPEVVLPDQMFPGAKLPAFVQSEGRLMLAILQDAVDCYQRHALTRNPRHREDFEEAKAWITSSDSDWVFSFENICNVLGIDPDYIRSGLAHRAPARGGYRARADRQAPRIVPLDSRRAGRSENNAMQASDTSLPIAS